MPFENVVHCPGVANVDLVMLIVSHPGQQFIARFPSRRFLAEKPLPHVVIDPNNRAVFGCKMPDCFRANQPGRAGNENSARFQLVVRRTGRSSRSTAR